jgi:hypothetical protein
MGSKSWQVFVMHLDLLDVLLSMNLKNAKTTYNFGIESNLDDNCYVVPWVSLLGEQRVVTGISFVL